MAERTVAQLYLGGPKKPIKSLGQFLMYAYPQSKSRAYDIIILSLTV